MKKVLVISLITGILLSSCTIGSGTPGIFSNMIWDDAGISTSNLDLDGNFDLKSERSRTISGDGVDEENKVYFRSSDIEFWSFSSIDEIETISPMEYQMGDETESIIFYPDSIIANDLSNNLNPNWDTDVSEFLASDTYTGEINMARLDIGAGDVDFIIDGIDRIVTIDTNCILFVDEKYVTTPFLLTRAVRDEIISGETDASDLNLSESETSFIKKIISLGPQSSNYMLNIDGALILPFKPYIIDDYDPDINSLVIEVKWDMNSAIYEELGSYYMTDRVSGTCFDFEVSIKVK